MMLAARLGAAPALRRAGADKIALHVGEAAKDGNHQAPGAGGGVGPRLGQRAELPARVHWLLGRRSHSVAMALEWIKR